MNSQSLHKLWQPHILEQCHGDQTVFNAELADLAKQYARENLTQKQFHFSTEKHDFSQWLPEPIRKQFRKMLNDAVQAYCREAFHNVPDKLPAIHTSVVWGEGQFGNAGVPVHIHEGIDLVITYYPEVLTDEQLKAWNAGGVRFYDHMAARYDFVENRNPEFFSNMWFQAEPHTGTLFVFPGWMMHDSGFFGGAERVCLPSFCRFDRATDSLAWRG